MDRRYLGNASDRDEWSDPTMRSLRDRGCSCSTGSGLCESFDRMASRLFVERVHKILTVRLACPPSSERIYRAEAVVHPGGMRPVPCRVSAEAQARNTILIEHLTSQRRWREHTKNFRADPPFVAACSNISHAIRNSTRAACAVFVIPHRVTTELSRTYMQTDEATTRATTIR